MKFFTGIFITLLLFGCSQLQADRLAELEGQMNTFAEEKEIVDTVNRLFISTDNRDWDAVKGCFTNEVNLDMTSMVGGEPSKMTSQQIVDAWNQGLQGLKAIHHQAGNYKVTLKNKAAEVFCYGIATHYLPNTSGRNSRLFVGSYNFGLHKVGKDWKIHYFKYNLKYIEGNLELHKYAK